MKGRSAPGGFCQHSDIVGRFDKRQRGANNPESTACFGSIFEFGFKLKSCSQGGGSTCCSVSEKEEAGELLQQETIAIFVIRDAQAAPKHIGIILEGQEVVNKLASVANAVAILLGFLYALNLEYPKTLKFTFQYIQKVFIELDLKGMPTKVKKLYDQLYNSA
ncbi:hypothetical protein NHX12_014428 [Muraenolepis orangiensis]|uniref:Uncharacterized protein n=1 Tax=Muraenolepis orangiensis TaxID=630683 RepID=A0A9Q0DBA1_9TELE|nr:hypothetical protein NHX12_014428 [Muraenolepis orangiensis]